jgi:uncharacterized protein
MNLLGDVAWLIYRENGMRRLWVRVLGLVGVPVLAAAGLDNNLPYMLLSHANRPVPDRPAILQQSAVQSEVVRFPSRDGLTIAGWFIGAPPRNPGAQSNRTLIVLHGLGGTREDVLPFVLPLQQQGINLLVLDLREHGQSEGEFFTYGFHEGKDVAGAIDYLTQRQDGSADYVTLLGVSAGATVAIAGAADSRVKGVITMAGFADLAQTIARQSSWLPAAWRQRAIARAEAMAKFKVAEASSLTKVKTLKCPKLIMHGTLDDYIPYADGEALFKAAAEPKQFFPIANASHANIFSMNADQSRDRIAQFIMQ